MFWMEGKDSFLCYQSLGISIDPSILHFPSRSLTDIATLSSSFWGPQLGTATPGRKKREHDSCRQDKQLDENKR